MDERLRFVAELLDGEKMAVVCREFGISRKTGYKIFNRHKDKGIRGLEDRPKSNYRHPNETPSQIFCGRFQAVAHSNLYQSVGFPAT